MKYLKRILTLVIFISFLSSLNAQKWAAPDANWKYNYFVYTVQGYINAYIDGDTIIEGKTALILQEDLSGHNNIQNNGFQNAFFKREYIYEDDGLVSIWNEDKWDTLYNYNAEIGDSWTPPKQHYDWDEDNCLYESYITLTVTEKGTMEIGGESLEFLAVTLKNNPENELYEFEFQDTIVERIGFLKSYYKVFSHCDDIESDTRGEGFLRCYSDEDVDYINSNYDKDCDFITTVGISKNDIDLNITLAPNPAQNEFEVIGDIHPKATFKVISLIGRTWEVERVDNKIDISFLPSGTYHLRIESDNQVSHHRFIKL